jgi:hypothetical protein
MMNFRSQLMQRFVVIFVRLWREKKAAGVEKPRVGRMAATLAGYGQKAHSPKAAVLAVDKQYCELVKRRDVLEAIRGLGLERDGRYWREIGEDRQASGADHYA